MLDAATNSVIIFDPDNPLQDTSVGLVLSAGASLNSSIAATSTGKAFIGTINGPPIELDIAKGSTKTLSANLGGLAKFVATPDGTHMFALNESDTRGTLAAWNSSTDFFSTQGLSGVFWTDLAVSPNGNRFAGIQGNLSFAASRLGCLTAPCTSLMQPSIQIWPRPIKLSALALSSAEAARLCCPLSAIRSTFSIQQREK